jgi:hypothetical protein
MTQRHRDASINRVSRENNVLRETSKIISKIACQRWGACLLFASPPLAASSNGNNDSKNSSLKVLTDRENDVR